MAFNKEVQVAPNGGWTPEFRARVTKVRDEMGLTLADIGEAMGFSGSFVHGLLAGKPTHRMDSKHADRVLRGLEGLEVRAGIKSINGGGQTLTAPSLDLDSLVREIHKRGFSVELKPLK